MIRVICLLLLCLSSASAHEQYSAWKRKDGTSCCGDKDCYQTEARYRDGFWWALRREDKKWLQIPSHLVIPGAANDGLAHLCALPPPDPETHAGDTIYCFMMEAMGG